MGVKWEEKDLWAGVKDTQKPGRGVLACKCGLPVRVTCFFSRAASICTTGEGRLYSLSLCRHANAKPGMA